MKVFFICFYFKRAFDKKLKEINDKKKETPPLGTANKVTNSTCLLLRIFRFTFRAWILVHFLQLLPMGVGFW